MRSPPRRANIRREPLFRTQAKKRPPGDQLILPTQYDLKEKINEASLEMKKNRYQSSSNNRKAWDDVTHPFVEVIVAVLI